MNKIATDHLAKLNAKLGPAGAQDADMVLCHDRLTVAMEAFSKTWSTWQNLDASHGGKTDVLQGLIAELSSTHIRKWDVANQGVFLDDTPEYAELLPEGRKPFQAGAIETRIQAVKTLGERLGNFAKFAELKATATEFHGKLKAARAVQKGREGDRDTASNDAKTARVALAGVLYANVGRLMEKHSAEPHRIEDYFDLSLIRSSGSEPVAPVPVPPPAVTPTADPAAKASGNGTASSSAGSTTVTELAPRITGNGSREHVSA